MARLMECLTVVTVLALAIGLGVERFWERAGLGLLVELLRVELAAWLESVRLARLVWS